MSTLHRVGVLAVLACTATAGVQAQQPKLDVKMGLWETTTQIHMGGMPAMPAMDLSKIPPAQRAQIEKAMETMAGEPVTMRSCMTKEKMQQGAFMQKNPNQNCTQTVTSSTARAMDATVVCTGAQAMTAQLHLDAPSATQYSGHMKGKTTGPGGAMEMNVEMRGRWLGSDCGDVE